MLALPELLLLASVFVVAACGLVYELAAGADVFVESYRTRKISNLGLSPEELTEPGDLSALPSSGAMRC